MPLLSAAGRWAGEMLERARRRRGSGSRRLAVRRASYRERSSRLAGMGMRWESRKESFGGDPESTRLLFDEALLQMLEVVIACS